MEELPKLGGYVKDLPDSNDYPFSELKTVLAETKMTITNNRIDLRRWCSPIENQRSLGSCTANGAVGGLEYHRIRLGLPHIDLSRLMNYYNARLMHGKQNEDSGSYIRLALGTLSSIGVCAESKWPYDVDKVFVRPTWGCYREAYANRIDGFYRVQKNGILALPEIREALQSLHPVEIGLTVDNEFQISDSRGIISVPAPVRVGEGGHAMLIVGYDDDTRKLILRNSWGVGWGDNGYCYLPYDYLDAGAATDMWVMTAGLIDL